MVISNETINPTLKSQSTSPRHKKLHKLKCWRLQKYKMPKSSNIKVKGDQIHDYNLKFIPKPNKSKHSS